MVQSPVCQRHVCKLSRLVNVWQYDYRIVVLEFDPASCLWHYMVMPLCSINKHSEKDALRNLNIGGDDFGMRGQVLSEVCPKLDRDAYSSSAGRSL